MSMLIFCSINYWHPVDAAAYGARVMRWLRRRFGLFSGLLLATLLLGQPSFTQKH